MTGSVSDSEWEHFVSGHADCTPYHRVAWQQVIEAAFGKKTYRVVARRANGSIAAALPLVYLSNPVTGKNLVSMPYCNYGGPLADSTQSAEDVTASAAELAATLGDCDVELRSFVPGNVNGWSARTDKVMMKLQLPPTLADLQSAIGAKVRSQIRRPEREGARSSTGGRELLGDFYQVFCRNMRDLGTPVYPRRFFDAIFDCLGSAARIVIVYLQDRPVAAGFLLGYEKTIEIPWASSIREYNRYGVNMMLYWNALQHAYAAGYEAFDFGRSTEGEGTFRFKKQWGAEPHPLTWHRLRECAGEGGTGEPGSAAARAVGLWQKLPLPIANFLGPRISPELPW